MPTESSMATVDGGVVLLEAPTMRCLLVQEDGGAVALIVFDDTRAPVNAMGADWQRDFHRMVECVVDLGATLQGVILASAKATFIVGADLKDVAATLAGGGARVFEDIERLKRSFRALERVGIPIVTCLNGSALGGGFEVALVGHHRIAVNDAKIRLGLPEVSIGMFPGGGGIVKMTRHLGLDAVRPYILESRLFDPMEAQRLALVHEVVPEPAQLLPRALAWIAQRRDPLPVTHPWERPGYRMPGGAVDEPQVAAMLQATRDALRLRTKGLYPAHAAVLDCMIECSGLDFDAAMTRETRYLATVIDAPETANLVTACFVDPQALRSGKCRPAGVPRFRPGVIDVLGDGPLARAFAQLHIRRGWTGSAATKPERDDSRAVIDARGDVPAFGLDGGIAVQAGTSRVSLLLSDGMPGGGVCEVVGGQGIEPAWIAAASDYLLAAGLLPIRVGDGPGHYVNRLRLGYALEGLAWSEEGRSLAALAEQTWLMDWRDDPLTAMTRVGCTHALALRPRLESGMSGKAWTGHPGWAALQRECADGELARFAEGSQRSDLPDVVLDTELRERLLYRLAVEAARCLREGVIGSVPEANLGAIHGAGMPAWSGGPLQFVRTEGLNTFVCRAGVLAQRHGARFDPTSDDLEALHAAFRSGPM